MRTGRSQGSQGFSRSGQDSGAAKLYTFSEGASTPTLLEYCVVLPPREGYGRPCTSVSAPSPMRLKSDVPVRIPLPVVSAGPAAPLVPLCDSNRRHAVTAVGYRP